MNASRVLQSTRYSTADRRPSRPSDRRGGVTVIELLTVIGILALLAAILLPAVQGARERSRTVSCGDRLRQLMVAVQNHEGVHGAFPESEPFFIDSSRELQPSVSIFVHLLPYIEQQESHNQIDFSDVSVILDEAPFTHNAANLALIDVQIPVYVCPSESSDRGVSYRACYGPGANLSAQAPFFVDKRYHSGSFTDGLIHTAMLSERAIGDGDLDRFDSWRDVFRFHRYELTEDTPAGWNARCSEGFPPGGPVESYSNSGVNWLRAGTRNTSYNHVFSPNSRIPDCAILGPYADTAPGAFTARSFHNGGVNVAFADCHVKFINDGIEFAIWQAFATRNGNEPIAGF